MSEDIAKLKTPPFVILKGLSNKLNLVFTFEHRHLKICHTIQNFSWKMCNDQLLYSAPNKVESKVYYMCIQNKNKNKKNKQSELQNHLKKQQGMNTTKPVIDYDFYLYTHCCNLPTSHQSHHTVWTVSEIQPCFSLLFHLLFSSHFSSISHTSLLLLAVKERKKI